MEQIICKIQPFKKAYGLDHTEPVATRNITYGGLFITFCIFHKKH